VNVIYMADFMREIPEVIALCETRKLGHVVQPHINKLLCARFLYPVEEIFGGRLGEANGKYLQREPPACIIARAPCSASGSRSW
jgi:hypothetical protein